MTKVKIGDHEYQVVRSKLELSPCEKCSFEVPDCPLGDEWPYWPLCIDYEVINVHAYLKRID